MEDIAGEKEMNTQKCRICGEVKILHKDFYSSRSYKLGYEKKCKECSIKVRKEYMSNPDTKEKARQKSRKYYSTEHGFLSRIFNNIRYRFTITRQFKHKCFLSLPELKEAFSRHKAEWKMCSAWGPYHLALTLTVQDNNSNSKGGRVKNTPSNLSVDRLDPKKPYTIQNIIFIRVDENDRKKDSTYEDCCTQKQLHEERFINMEAQ